jgi:hypothetical protein
LICGLVGLAAVIIFCAGLIVAVISLASEYDSFRLLTFSALVGSGVGMMGLSSLIIIALFAIPTSANKTKSSEKFAGYLTPALQEALAALVLDLVKQRSASRTVERPQPQSSGPSPSSHDPTYSTH